MFDPARQLLSGHIVIAPLRAWQRPSAMLGAVLLAALVAALAGFLIGQRDGRVKAAPVSVPAESTSPQTSPVDSALKAERDKRTELQHKLDAMAQEVLRLREELDAVQQRAKKRERRRAEEEAEAASAADGTKSPSDQQPAR